jgi:hypothetical protein
MKKAVMTIAVLATTGGLYGQAAADPLFVPFLTVGEEYTDNVYDAKDNKRTDYITRLRPGFTSKYQAARWQWDVAYNLDYRYYARDSKKNDLAHDANIKGSITLLENFFFLDLSDTYKLVSLDIGRDATQSSLSANQSEQNIATINPWLLWRPGQKTILKTGYRYIDTRYWDGDGIDKKAHNGYADLTYEMTAKLNLLAGYGFTHQTSSDNLDYDKHDVSGGFRYKLAEQSQLYATLGYTWQDFSNDYSSNYLFWNAGLVQNLGLFVATLEAKRQVTEDPLADSTRETSYSIKLDRPFARGSIGLLASRTSYDTTVNASGSLTDDYRKTTLGLTGSYEITEGVKANATVSGERFSYDAPAVDDYRYRLLASLGLSWQLLPDLNLGLSYTRVSNQDQLDSSSGGWDTNRVIVDLKKTF